MSILIRGMEMPESCGLCSFEHEELQERGIKYLIVAPKNTPEIKNEYCKRYLKRGSHIDLIDKVYRDWDNMIASIKADPSPCIWLDSGEYLADVLSKEGE